MRKLLGLMFLFFVEISYAQESLNYYALQDSIPVYSGRGTDKYIYLKVEHGFIFQSPNYVSADWIGFDMPHLADTVFIEKRKLGFESEFLKSLSTGNKLNGRSKYELLKLKLRNDDYAGSQDLLFDLLNNHREWLNTGGESCDQLNVLALEMYFGGYPKPKQPELLKKVISDVKDKNIKAMASYIALRYSILNEQILLSEFYIKKIINGELPNLILQGCDYSVYFSVHPLIEAKKVIASYFLYVGRERSDIMIEFIESNISEKPNLKSDFCKDVLKIINDGNFETHYEYISK